MAVSVDIPEHVVVRGLGIAALVVAVQLLVAALLFGNGQLFLASLPALIVGIAILGATTWLRAPAPLAMMATAVAIAAEAGLVDESRVHTLGFGAIIVLGLIAVMMSAQRWMSYTVAFASVLVVTSGYWNRNSTSAHPFIEGFGLAIVFLMGASMAAWVRMRKMKADERYRTLVQRAPISIWEEDFTHVDRWLDGLRSEGVTDLAAFLTSDLVRDASRLIIVKEVNQACVDLLEAHDRAELVGRLSMDSVSDDTIEALTAQILTVWERRDHLMTEVKGQTLRGNPIEGVLHWFAPTIDGKLDLSSVVVSVTDVRPLKETQRRLAQLIDSKDQFVASVSHELRTPLTSVVGFSAELRDHLDSFSPTDLREMLDLIASQAGDVGNIVEDLLVAARADLGTISLSPERLDVRLIIREVTSGHPPDAIDLPDDELSVIVDSTRLRQILRNLLTNARRYGGSHVALEAGRENERVWIEVRDDGLGVKPTDEGRIFLPYETAHHRAGVTASVGLGLAVARQLAHLMHGELSYERRQRLTIFRLDFPEARAEQAQLL
jgi:signal transduction histidine kinase